MIRFKAFTALSKAYLFETLRSKTTIFWSQMFPLVFVVGFGAIFGAGDPERVAYVLPGVLTINLIGAAFFGISYNMVSQREKGLFRRYQVTPLTAGTILTAYSVTAMINLLVSLFLQLLTAKLVFGLNVFPHIVPLFFASLLGGFAFIPLGLLVGSTARDSKSAPAIANLLFFPLMFLSGAAMPLFAMPEWLQQTAKLLPSTYIVELFQGVIARGLTLNDLGPAMVILALTGLFAYVANASLFRWEQNQPISKPRLIGLLGFLAVIYSVAFIFGPSLTSAEAPIRPGTQETVLLQNLKLRDDNNQWQENQAVLVVNGKVRTVGTPDQIRVPKDAEILDLEGAYLIPGLIDAHVHLGGSPGANSDMREFSPLQVERRLQAYLASGVTSVLSLTDNINQVRPLIQRARRGEQGIPRIFFAGASITAPGGHPAARFSAAPGLAEALTRQVETEAEARAAVVEMVEAGATVIKLVLEDGHAGQPLPKLSEPLFRAAVDEAKKQGLPVRVHVGSDADAALALSAGVDGLEHIPIDLTEETARGLAEAGITITPTLAVFDGLARIAESDPFEEPWIRARVDDFVFQSLNREGTWMDQLRAAPEAATALRGRFERAVAATRTAREQGVVILAGSDAGNPATWHGVSLIQELQLLVEQVGMTPAEALDAATRLSAEHMGQGLVGRIRPEAAADFVILEEDPLADIQVLRRPKQVWLRGKKVEIGQSH